MIDTTYVPTWLTIGDRDATGWPKFVTATQRDWLTGKVRELLERHGPLTIHTIVGQVFADPDAPRWVLLDAQYAAVHRALLAADCDQVWRAGK